ncbi:MAG: hypothetical protein DELT_00964 [Desulfovibrio sp.]
MRAAPSVARLPSHIYLIGGREHNFTPVPKNHKDNFGKDTFSRVKQPLSYNIVSLTACSAICQSKPIIFAFSSGAISSSTPSSVWRKSSTSNSPGG